MTPAKFVEQARLEAARCTLEQTALPVEAIAERCGFGDLERYGIALHVYMRREVLPSSVRIATSRCKSFRID
jgi:transcriptional regulator GlxA family with amidase domain